MAALETLIQSSLQFFGAATATASGTNGLVQGASAGQSNFLLRGDRTWQNPAIFAKLSDIDTAIQTLILGAPDALNTLDELARALADDANFATTITNQFATKVDKIADSIFFPQANSHTSENPNNFTSGIKGIDQNLDGTSLKGWHIITVLRPANTAYGFQLACSDTEHLLLYRSKTANNWAIWKKIAFA